jgi:hypothetical protein
MRTLTIAAILSTSVLFVAAPASADSEPAARHAVLGEKLDSGLGEMPVYRRVVGEKVDSGLGELPHYRHWSDKTGKAPLQPQLLATAERK